MSDNYDNLIAYYNYPKTNEVIISYLFIQFLRGEPSMIYKFPDFSLTSEDFLISLTILHNSLTLKKKQISLTSGHPDWALMDQASL